jgi:hypothetical protein
MACASEDKGCDGQLERASGGDGGAAWEAASWVPVCRWDVCTSRDWQSVRPWAACSFGARQEAGMSEGSLLAARRPVETAAEICGETRVEAKAADARRGDSPARGGRGNHAHRGVDGVGGHPLQAARVRTAYFVYLPSSNFWTSSGYFFTAQPSDLMLSMLLQRPDFSRNRRKCSSSCSDVR